MCPTSECRTTCRHPDSPGRLETPTGVESGMPSAGTVARIARLQDVVQPAIRLLHAGRKRVRIVDGRIGAIDGAQFGFGIGAGAQPRGPARYGPLDVLIELPESAWMSKLPLRLSLPHGLLGQCRPPAGDGIRAAADRGPGVRRCRPSGSGSNSSVLSLRRPHVAEPSMTHREHVV